MPIYHKICVICGKPFDTNRRNRKTCGAKECAAKHNSQVRKQHYERYVKKTKVQKICVICGKPFETNSSKKNCCGDPQCISERNRRYARKHAERIRSGEIVPITCVFCGKTVKRKKGTEYCSKACRKAHEKVTEEIFSEQLAAHNRAYDIPTLRSLTLSEVSALAQSAHLSYGRYCAREEYRYAQSHPGIR